MGKDAAFQIFAKGLADVGLGGVVVTLAVELAGAGQFKPGLEVLGCGLVQQRALGVARVVEFGLCTRLPARVGWVPDDPRFLSYQPDWAARAHLLQRSGATDASDAAYAQAIGLELDPAERRFCAC